VNNPPPADPLAGKLSDVSTYSSVNVPGLTVIPSFLTPSEVEDVESYYASPNCKSWFNQSRKRGGRLRRRVIHYGYVFDYEVRGGGERSESQEGLEIGAGTDARIDLRLTSYDSFCSSQARRCSEGQDRVGGVRGHGGYGGGSEESEGDGQGEGRGDQPVYC